jgi:hypothetical protein
MLEEEEKNQSDKAMGWISGELEFKFQQAKRLFYLPQSPNWLYSPPGLLSKERALSPGVK